MVVESWITPEETPALAAQARAVIDECLSRVSDAERDAYWASIRKAYNTPYNPPVKTIEAARVTIDLVDAALPVAVMAQSVPGAEAHAA